MRLQVALLWRSSDFFNGLLAAARATWLDEKGLAPEQQAERDRSGFLSDVRHNGKVLVFHSTRHTYAANLKRAGVSMLEAVHLCRHSDPRLTVRRYGALALHDLAGAVAKLGAIQLPAVEPVAATGTDNAHPAAVGGGSGCLADRLAESGGRAPIRIDSGGRQAAAKQVSETPENLDDKRGFPAERR
jgi:hypothetical protein